MSTIFQHKKKQQQQQQQQQQQVTSQTAVQYNAIPPRASLPAASRCLSPRYSQTLGCADWGVWGCASLTDRQTNIKHQYDTNTTIQYDTNTTTQYDTNTTPSTQIKPIYQSNPKRTDVSSKEQKDTTQQQQLSSLLFSSVHAAKNTTQTLNT